LGAAEAGGFAGRHLRRHRAYERLSKEQASYRPVSHDEADPHHRQARAHPGQERSLCGKLNARVHEILLPILSGYPAGCGDVKNALIRGKRAIAAERFTGKNCTDVWHTHRPNI
jgi:hypothetical protein